MNRTFSGKKPVKPDAMDHQISSFQTWPKDKKLAYIEMEFGVDGYKALKTRIRKLEGYLFMTGFIAVFLIISTVAHIAKVS